MVADWIWKLCNMAFESGAVLEDWRSAVIVPLYMCKGERANVAIIEVLACVVGKNTCRGPSGQTS